MTSGGTSTEGRSNWLAVVMGAEGRERYGCGYMEGMSTKSDAGKGAGDGGLTTDGMAMTGMEVDGEGDGVKTGETSLLYSSVSLKWPLC